MAWFLPKLSEKISSLRTNFENFFAEFTVDKGHSAHPFLSAQEWKDNKSSSKLLDMLDEVGKKKFEGLKKQFTLKGNENIVPGTNREEVRIVLIGKTGVGKSATGNTILGVRRFEDSYAAGSVTRKSIKKFREINGRLISVIDTPGLFDTDRSKEVIFEEIARVMKVFSKGIHAFIYVQDISNPRFTEENKKTLDFIEELFGGGIKPFLLLVYTKADTLGESDLNQFCDEQMKDARQAVAQFLRDLDWRIVAVNNKTTTPAEKRRNQEIIIAMVDKLKNQNKNAVYSNEMFHEAAEKRRELKEKGKKKGWNEQVMEAVDAVIEQNPDISKDNKKLMEYVLKHLEQKQKDIETKLNEAKQTKEERQEENNESTTKVNLEDELNQAHNEPGHEKENQVLKQIQNRENTTKSCVKLTQELKGGATLLEPLVEKAELKKDETDQRQDKDVPEYENKTKIECKDEEKEVRKELEEALEREREEKRMILEKQAHEREKVMKEREELITENESRLRLSREALDDPKELKGGATTLQPLVEKAELKKDEIDQRQDKDAPEYGNKAKPESENEEKKLRKELEEALERERTEKRMILEKQTQERERAMKEREELIKENESRLRLSREALDNAKNTNQITEIAKEHDDIVTSMVGVVTSGFTKMLTTGVSSVLNYGKSWFGY